MSRNGSHTAAFGDDDYTFRLGWGEWRDLQEACDAGPYVILDRLAAGRWRIEDIREVIRYGLIGGGLEPAKALKLIRQYVEDRPPMGSWKLALDIATAGVIGAPEEEVGKKAEAASRGRGKRRSRTANSGSLPSTEQAPSSASPRKKSTA